MRGRQRCNVQRDSTERSWSEKPAGRKTAGCARVWVRRGERDDLRGRLRGKDFHHGPFLALIFSSKYLEASFRHYGTRDRGKMREEKESNWLEILDFLKDKRKSNRCHLIVKSEFSSLIFCFCSYVTDPKVSQRWYLCFGFILPHYFSSPSLNLLIPAWHLFFFCLSRRGGNTEWWTPFKKWTTWLSSLNTWELLGLNMQSFPLLLLLLLLLLHLLLVLLLPCLSLCLLAILLMG